MKDFFKKTIAYILEWEARILIKRLKPKIIAVSGSVGKTSTKDAIYTALTPFVSVRKSNKSFNSEIGLPLTILDLPNAWGNPWGWVENVCKGLFYALFLKDYPDYLVLEVGSDRPGDIARVAMWLPVYVAVLTRCPSTPVHVEFFKDGHELNEEDKKIARAVRKDGMIIVNADDEEQSDMRVRYPHVRHVTYGIAHTATVRGTDISYTYADAVPTGISCTAMIGQRSLPLVLSGVVGQHHVYPHLAALAVIEGLGYDVSQSMQALLMHTTPKGRMNIIAGKNGSTIIDDTYNSSPVAVEEALATLKNITVTGKKIAVLGDMLELGQYTEREHRRIGAVVAETVDILVTLGIRSEDTVKGAVEAGMDKNSIHSYTNTSDALVYLNKHIHEGDIVLVKGSQGMRMERIVLELMMYPEKAKELLVRQEKEWESR